MPLRAGKPVCPDGLTVAPALPLARDLTAATHGQARRMALGNQRDQLDRLGRGRFTLAMRIESKLKPLYR